MALTFYVELRELCWTFQRKKI